MFSSLSTMVVSVSLVASALSLPSFFTLTPYAPTSAQCPSTPLFRQAQGLSADEAWYRDHRSAAAAQSLREWYATLNKARPTNESFPVDTMPVIGLASSGGSVRALLTGAGLVQALDSRDTAPSAQGIEFKGIYQSLTYHTGLEAGAWLIAALSATPGATITSIVNNIWSTSFSTDDFLPVSARGSTTYSNIALDLVAKAIAGYPPTLVDTWGRLLSQHFVYDGNAGVATTLSGIANTSDWQEYKTPFPILTALAVDPTVPDERGCVAATDSSPQYEFSPFEYGSWAAGSRRFARTFSMGSPTVKDRALARRTCVQGFDNLGFLLAVSGNEFNYWCSEIPRPNLLSGPLGELKNSMIEMTALVHGLSFLDEYAILPASGASWATSLSSDELYLVSGSQAQENIPMWPLIQPDRAVNIVIANDNSQDTPDFFPNGTSLYTTYLRAQREQLSTMPLIPPPEVFIERGYNKRPTFFGCYDRSKISIVYLANTQYNFPSNIPDWIMKYTSEEVMLMLENGNQVATFGSNQTYKPCLACFLLWKVKDGRGLPRVCLQCMNTFCYQP